ncbi:MAG TPA: glycerol kinase GlpK [Candidatus Deferrimicrobiaceae bacterium]|nr:glycerol kinase GlpK [Candidatus Deferrimicrobiaceae bacterium]
MTARRFVLALDQGTTGSTALVIDPEGLVRARGYAELPQHYPQPGWVEHDPAQIWATTAQALGQAVASSGITPAEIAAVGITNQRETTILWERASGRPVGNAIVWQCRRTAALCDRLKADGAEPEIRRKTGLVVDAYFSGTKIRWLLDHDPALRPRAERGELCFGTVDTWLLWQLTGGAVHATDPSNASRTLCYDIHALRWDEGLCRLLDVPMALLPEVKPSAGVFGESAKAAGLPPGILVAGIAGDQQAALFGQACVEPGMAKNTYGTGCFALLNTGERAVASREGLLTTVAWTVEGRTAYALEGAVFIAGAAVQWLRDSLGIIGQAAETQALAESVPDTGGVYLVPAFVGLGAPYWDPYARGTLVGITRGTTRAHLARAALEAIAYQSRDVLDTMKRESGVPLTSLRVDGGASANDFLCQFQADVLGVEVLRPSVTETTGLGAAYLAGVGAGLWKSRELASRWKLERKFTAAMSDRARETAYEGWRRAVERSRGWARP